MKFPRPKFSLLSLVLVSLFIPSIALVWLWREPWTFVQLKEESSPVCPTIAPDQKREIQWHRRESFRITDCDIIDLNSKKVLWSFSNHGYLVGPEWSGSFLSNDEVCITILVLQEHLKPPCTAYFTRRFPEWWWGHFYRPEVWLAIFFGISTLVSLFKTKRVGAADATPTR